MSDVLIYRAELPAKIKGTTIIKNGDYIVLINSLLCEETQKKALMHELMHIDRNHFFDDIINVNICEYEVNSFYSIKNSHLTAANS